MMQSQTVVSVGSVGRVFTSRPDQLAAAWRRVRSTHAQPNTAPDNLLDTVVEPFIQEIGKSLSGQRGNAWSRTRGVLRVCCSPLGERRLREEFSALRRCLIDALEVLSGTALERMQIEVSIDAATDSAVALCRRLTNTTGAPPEVPFGGLVVEYFERVDAPMDQSEEVLLELH